MANIADVVVFDGAIPPVSHTLKALSVERNKTSGKIEAVWREQLATLPTYAQAELRLSLVRTSRSGVWHATWGVRVPVMESVSGQNSAGYTAAPKVAYVNEYGCYGHFHERSTIAERRLVKQMVNNLGGNVSTSVTPVSAGVIDELVSQLIMPT